MAATLSGILKGLRVLSAFADGDVEQAVAILDGAGTTASTPASSGTTRSSGCGTPGCLLGPGAHEGNCIVDAGRSP